MTYTVFTYRSPFKNGNSLEVISVRGELEQIRDQLPSTVTTAYEVDANNKNEAIARVCEVARKRVPNVRRMI